MADTNGVDGPLRVTNRDMFERIEIVATAVTSLQTTLAVIGRDIASMSNTIGELRTSDSRVLDRLEDTDRRAIDMHNRMSNVERQLERPPLSDDEQREVRRIIGVVKQRGLVDILTPDEITDTREMVKKAPTVQALGEENRSRVIAVEQRNHDLSNALQATSLKQDAADQRVIDLTQRVDAQRGNLNSLTVRFDAVQPEDHLAGKELADVRRIIGQWRTDQETVVEVFRAKVASRPFVILGAAGLLVTLCNILIATGVLHHL